MDNSRVCKSTVAFAIVALAIGPLLVGSVTSSSAAIEKMKPEHLVARHLESIGPTKERASIKTRILPELLKSSFARPRQARRLAEQYWLPRAQER